ncbi:MAG: hypothetical protein U0694_10595 [Anaerolineae bacterium]
MKDSARLFATLIIWAALVVMVVSPTSNLEGAAAVLVALAGMATTIAVWLSGINSGQRQEAPAIAAEKSKRNARDRVSRLVQQMDDDEIAQLSDLLSQNDDSARYNERLG